MTVYCIKTRATQTVTNKLLAAWARASRPIIVDRQLDSLHAHLVQLLALRRLGQ